MSPYDLDELIDEEWRDAVDYWPYQVSNLGRVRRSPDVSRPKNYSKPIGHVRSPSLNNKGYPMVVFYGGRSERAKGVLVHKLVAAAFIGPRPKGLQVNHKNGVKTDNRDTNLEYTTNRKNRRHAVRMGLVARKLSLAQILEIRECLVRGDLQRDLAKTYDVGRTTISAIATRRNWAWL